MSTSDSIKTPVNIVSLSDNALGQIRSMWADNSDDQGKPLRVYVEEGGCSGMQYGLVFDEIREGDLIHEFEEVKVVVDPVSAEYMTGSVVDYSEDLVGGGFKITNPNARQSCGCGKSFEA